MFLKFNENELDFSHCRYKMEDVYTVKIKTKPDTRNAYPSERRYSASTVSGLAWVHIALAATSFLLASLALINPSSDITRLNSDDATEAKINRSELIFNLAEFNTTNNENNETSKFVGNTSNPTDSSNATSSSTDSNYILVVAPTLLTIFALAAGIASILASVRWYIDRNITWLFLVSTLSSAISFISLVMVAVWFVKISNGDIKDFYKDRDPFNDFLVVKHSDVVAKNDSHIVIKNSQSEGDNTANLFTKRVLSINILIACFLELLWSMLTVNIAYKGMKNTYKDDVERRGNTVSVVTKIKGNNMNLFSNGMKPKPDLMNYPSKIKKVFLVQNANGYFIKNQNNKTKQNTETSSEFCKERMMNFLNRCAMEDIDTEVRTPSEHSDLTPIQEVRVEINKNEEIDLKDRMTPVSWGDTPNHTIYNQNTLNLEKIFNFGKKEEEKDGKRELNVEFDKKEQDESKTDEDGTQ